MAEPKMTCDSFVDLLKASADGAAEECRSYNKLHPDHFSSEAQFVAEIYHRLRSKELPSRTILMESALEYELDNPPKHSYEYDLIYCPKGIDVEVAVQVVCYNRKMTPSRIDRTFDDLSALDMLRSDTTTKKRVLIFANLSGKPVTQSLEIKNKLEEIKSNGIEVIEC